MRIEIDKEVWERLSTQPYGRKSYKLTIFLSPLGLFIDTVNWYTCSLLTLWVKVLERQMTWLSIYSSRMLKVTWGLSYQAT